MRQNVGQDTWTGKDAEPDPAGPETMPMAGDAGRIEVALERFCRRDWPVSRRRATGAGRARSPLGDACDVHHSAVQKPIGLLLRDRVPYLKPLPHPQPRRRPALIHTER